MIQSNNDIWSLKDCIQLYMAGFLCGHMRGVDDDGSSKTPHFKKKGGALLILFVVSTFFLSKGLRRVMCILDISPLWLNPRYDAVTLSASICSMLCSDKVYIVYIVLSLLCTTGAYRGDFGVLLISPDIWTNLHLPQSTVHCVWLPLC